MHYNHKIIGKVNFLIIQFIHMFNYNTKEQWSETQYNQN